RIGNPRWACRRAAVAVYLRAVEIHRAVIYRSPSRARGTVDFPDRHPAARRPLDVIATWAAHVGAVVVHIRVVDDGGAVIDRYPIPIRRVIAIQPRTGDVALRDKYPVAMGNADMHVDAHAWSQR